MKLIAFAAIAILGAALFAAGCGGGGSGGSNTTTPPPPGGTNGAAPKKATAPGAPAGSKVVSCATGPADAQDLRATAVGCGTARATMLRWERAGSCGLPADAARGSCSLGGFRCQAVRVDKGIAVSCAHPGGDVSFIAHRARSHF